MIEIEFSDQDFEENFKSFLIKIIDPGAAQTDWSNFWKSYITEYINICRQWFKKELESDL